MPHWGVLKARMIMLCGTVLLSMVPATAGAIGTTTTTVQPRSQTAVIEVPRDGAGRQVRETQDMPIRAFISGMVLGLSLGLLGYRVLQG
jgi:hypothetical protein